MPQIVMLVELDGLDQDCQSETLLKKTWSFLLDQVIQVIKNAMNIKQTWLYVVCHKHIFVSIRFNEMLTQSRGLYFDADICIMITY